MLGSRPLHMPTGWQERKSRKSPSDGWERAGSMYAWHTPITNYFVILMKKLVRLGCIIQGSLAEITNQRFSWNTKRFGSFLLPSSVVVAYRVCMSAREPYFVIFSISHFLAALTQFILPQQRPTPYKCCKSRCHHTTTAQLVSYPSLLYMCS